MKFVYLKAYPFSVKVICLMLLHLESSWCKLNKLVNKKLCTLYVISQCYMPAASVLSVTQVYLFFKKRTEQFMSTLPRHSANN